MHLRLRQARLVGLEQLVADWESDSPELDAVVARLAEELEETDESRDLSVARD